jgi:transcription factor STE12
MAKSHNTTTMHSTHPSRPDVIRYDAETNKLSPCRHKRTHDRNDGAEGSFNSGEEEEQYSGEDQMDSLEDASPTSENGYVAGSLDAAVNGNNVTSNGVSSSNPGLGQTQTFNSLQTLSMPMTISQPHAINTGGMA